MVSGEARTAHEPLPAAGLVIAQPVVGDDEAALRWMERALEARDYWLVMLRFDPSMARLRETPRFVSLLERVRPETPA